MGKQQRGILGETRRDRLNGQLPAAILDQRRLDCVQLIKDFWRARTPGSLENEGENHV